MKLIWYLILGIIHNIVAGNVFVDFALKAIKSWSNEMNSCGDGSEWNGSCLIHSFHSTYLNAAFVRTGAGLSKEKYVRTSSIIIKIGKMSKISEMSYTHTHTQHISQNGNRTIPSSHTHTRVNRPNILLNESQKYFLTRIFSLFDPFLAMWISNHISYYVLFSVKICSFWITDIFIIELQNGYIEWIVCTMRIDCLGKMTVCFISFNSCRNGMREKITYAHTHTQMVSACNMSQSQARFWNWLIAFGWLWCVIFSHYEINN